MHVKCLGGTERHLAKSSAFGLQIKTQMHIVVVIKIKKITQNNDIALKEYKYRTSPKRHSSAISLSTGMIYFDVMSKYFIEYLDDILIYKKKYPSSSYLCASFYVGI